MSARIAVLLFCVFLILVSTANAEKPMKDVPSNSSTPAIVALDGIQPGQTIFKSAQRNKPIEIKSKDEAAKFFNEQALTQLTAKVDFEDQIVLVFAWRGSGQDRLLFNVAESFPEQITFEIAPGRTRDLRPHVYVFALRDNVKWDIR